MWDSCSYLWLTWITGPMFLWIMLNFKSPEVLLVFIADLEKERISFELQAGSYWLRKMKRDWRQVWISPGDRKQGGREKCPVSGFGRRKIRKECLHTEKFGLLLQKSLTRKWSFLQFVCWYSVAKRRLIVRDPGISSRQVLSTGTQAPFYIPNNLLRTSYVERDNENSFQMKGTNLKSYAQYQLNYKERLHILSLGFDLLFTKSSGATTGRSYPTDSYLNS